MSIKAILSPVVLAIGVFFTPAGGELAFGQAFNDAQIMSYVNNRPTVSPYLQLINTNGNFDSTVARYQQYVRPAMESRQAAQFQQDEINRLRRQTISTAQSVNNLQQQAQMGIRPTGHETRYMNYSRFYPGLRPAGAR